MAAVTDLARAQARIAALEAALTQAERENLALRQKLDLLCHKVFGKKSEGVSPDQLRLAFAQLAEALKPRDEPTEMDTGERPGQQHRQAPRPTGRRPLPASLPRQRVEVDVPEAFLSGFAGDLQADAYTGYDALYRTAGSVSQIADWRTIPSPSTVRARARF